MFNTVIKMLSSSRGCHTTTNKQKYTNKDTSHNNTPFLTTTTTTITDSSSSLVALEEGRRKSVLRIDVWFMTKSLVRFKHYLEMKSKHSLSHTQSFTYCTYCTVPLFSKYNNCCTFVISSF